MAPEHREEGRSVTARLNKEDCILFSGAAQGAEAEFGAAAERHGIETLVTLQVTSYLKGDYGPQVTFRVPPSRWIVKRERVMNIYRLVSKAPNYMWRFGLFAGVRLLCQCEPDAGSRRRLAVTAALHVPVAELVNLFSRRLLP